MRAVVQNPLPGDDVLRVPFVVAAGVEIAIVFREAGGGDRDAKPMACRYDAGREPEIDVVLVGLSRFDKRRLVVPVAEPRAHDTVLDALDSSVRVDVEDHDIPVGVLRVGDGP